MLFCDRVSVKPEGISDQLDYLAMRYRKVSLGGLWKLDLTKIVIGHFTGTGVQHQRHYRLLSLEPGIKVSGRDCQERSGAIIL